MVQEIGHLCDLWAHSSDPNNVMTDQGGGTADQITSEQCCMFGTSRFSLTAPCPEAEIIGREEEELMVEAYQRMFGFELIVLRLANVYGVGHFAGGSGGGEMVQNMLQTGIKGGVVKIAQEVARDFEYVYYKDLGRALDKAATTPLKEPVTLNIGTGVVIPFDDLVATAEKLLPKLQVEIIPGTKPRSAKQPMVIKKAKEVLGWQPDFDIEAGFKDYIEELKALG